MDLESFSVLLWASQVALVVKNLPTNAGGPGSIPGLGRSPGGEHGNSLQYSCMENPMDRGAGRATVLKSWTQLKLLSTPTYISISIYLYAHAYSIHYKISKVCKK